MATIEIAPITVFFDGTRIPSEDSSSHGYANAPINVRRMQTLHTLDRYYERYGYLFLLAACFLLPLKLSLAYCALVPLILLWLVSIRFRIWGALRGDSIILPYAGFVAFAVLTIPFAVDPLRSADKLLGVVFFGLSIPVFRDVIRSYDYERPLFALVSGQTVAAVHSVLEGALGTAVPRLFLGAVTESGQLALSVILTTGLLTLAASQSRKTATHSLSGIMRGGVLAVLNFVALTLLAFMPLTERGALPFAAALCLAGSLLTFTLWRHRTIRLADTLGQDRMQNLLLTVILPLLLAALLVNLKRGPWLGVLAGGLTFLFLERRRLLVPVVAVVIALLVAIPPIQQRLAKSEEHFFIVGGRSEIWDIGAELATRFPLGVGYRNSAFLQHFSDKVPHDLNHFHNNFLNILVETGWLGLALFLWWIFTLLNATLRTRTTAQKRILLHALGCAVLSWQVAGLVEYNFGDSEVVLVAFLVAGAIAALQRAPSE